MNLQNTNTSYGSVAKFFHWLIFLLVLCMLIYGFFLGSIPKSSQAFAYNLHKLTGLTIFVLMVLNILWRLGNPKPIWPFNMPPWQRISARIVHILLYVLVVTMPMLGLVGSVAGGHPPQIGNFKITLPIAQNKALSDASFATHNFVAFILIILIVIHASAALYHHLIKRDNILRRMLPGRAY